MMRGIQFLEIHISMDFGDGQIPENFPIRPRSLRAKAFIREAANMIWTLGIATRFTKLDTELAPQEESRWRKPGRRKKDLGYF